MRIWSSRRGHGRAVRGQQSGALPIMTSPSSGGDLITPATGGKLPKHAIARELQPPEFYQAGSAIPTSGSADRQSSKALGRSELRTVKEPAWNKAALRGWIEGDPSRGRSRLDIWDEVADPEMGIVDSVGSSKNQATTIGRTACRAKRRSADLRSAPGRNPTRASAAPSFLSHCRTGRSITSPGLTTTTDSRPVGQGL